MVGTEVIWVAGSNVAECSPITTNYMWQAREQGARIIVQDPRITPAARTCDLFLPVKPGRDAALFAGVLQSHDRARLARSRVHQRLDRRLRCRSPSTAVSGRLHARPMSPACPSGSIRQAAEWWGTARSSFLFHARGIEHHSNGVAELARHDQPGAGVRPHRQAEVRIRDDRRSGERPGWPGARAEMRSAARLA